MEKTLVKKRTKNIYIRAQVKNCCGRTHGEASAKKRMKSCPKIERTKAALQGNGQKKLQRKLPRKSLLEISARKKSPAKVRMEIATAKKPHEKHTRKNVQQKPLQKTQ